LHMQEELGELARIMLIKDGYKSGNSDMDNVSSEIMDLLYLVIKISNHYNLDLDQEWEKMLVRYEEK